MHELKVGYEAVMGNSTPWKNLGRWAPHVKRLREKRPNLDPADFGARFRAFLELTKQRNIAVQPDQFFDRYDTLEPEPEWKPRPLNPVLVELERRKKAQG